MKRYNLTERQGINAVEAKIISELKWIFRAQPIVDVGIDALIEECIDDDPKGRYFALQVKSGEGNFHLSKTKAVYYMSGTHYYYWCDHMIPVLLVGYLPKQDKVIWEYVCQENCRSTPNGWKIEIPLNQELSQKTKQKLESILNEESGRYHSLDLLIEDELSAYDYIEDCENGLIEAKESLYRMIDCIRESGEVSTESNLKFRSFIDGKLSGNNPRVKAAVKTYARKLISISKRIDSEVEIYSESGARGIRGYKFTFLNCLLFDIINKSDFERAIDGLHSISKSTDDSLDELSKTTETIEKLHKENDFNDLKATVPLLVKSYKRMMTELQSFKELSEELKESALEIYNNAR